MRPKPPPSRFSLRFKAGAVRLVLGALALAAIPRADAIVNGSPASADEFPGIAALVLKGNFGFVPVVGGAVVVGDRWAVTAAHSVVDRAAASLQIWTGMTDLTDPSGRIVANVVQIYRHPDFTQGEGTSSADLAVLLLDRVLPASHAIALADEDDPIAPGALGAVAGWGTTTPGVFEPSSVLMRAPAGIVGNAFANTFFSGDPIDDTHLAARDPDLVQSPCNGDSGSPLVLELPEGDGVVTKLAGLVSFGALDCANTQVPTAYTSIPRFAPYIRGLLELTAQPPQLVVTGRQRRIPNGRMRARGADATDFGAVRPFRGRTRRFLVRNQGGGILFVESVRATGRSFSVWNPPPTLLHPGASQAVAIRFEPRGRALRHRGQVQLRTNQPGSPVYRFRVEGRQRR